MYALSVRQPWADALVIGAKSVEIRTRRYGIRLNQVIAIHAGKQADRNAPYAVGASTDVALRGRGLLDWYMTNTELRRGGIVGAARIVNLVAYRDAAQFREDYRRHLNPPEWWAEGLWGYVFSEPQFFKEIIPCRGQLGFWWLERAVEGRVAQMESEIRRPE